MDQLIFGYCVKIGKKENKFMKMVHVDDTNRVTLICPKCGFEKKINVTNFKNTQRGFFEDVIRNISAGGLYIETNLLSELGQKLTMTFSHPDSGDPIKVLGKVN